MRELFRKFLLLFNNLYNFCVLDELRDKEETAFYIDRIKISPKYLEVWKKVPIFATEIYINMVVTIDEKYG